MKKQISQTDYLKLRGIMAVVSEHNDHLEMLKKAACNIVGEKAQWGHMADVIYGGDDLDGKLLALEIEVIEEMEQLCDWWQVENGTWQAECGMSWFFTTGTPAENHIIFCMRCSRKVREVGVE